MKTGKDISTLFREGSEKLSVEPAPRAWQRLERRLENHGQRGRMVWLKRLAAAAAVLVLVGGAYFLNETLQHRDFAVQNEPEPQRLEVLVNTEGCKPYCLVLQARKELPPYYANPVEKMN